VAISGLKGRDLAKGELLKERGFLVGDSEGEGREIQLNVVVFGGDQSFEGAGVVGVGVKFLVKEKGRV